MSCYEKLNGEGSLTLELFKELKKVLIESLTKDINNAIKEVEKEDLTQSQCEKRIKELKEYLPNSRTLNFPIFSNGYTLGYITLNKELKTFSIHINKGNRVVDDAEGTYVYSSFLNFLDKLPKNRKLIKAKIYYENEYHEYGGNTAYYGYTNNKYLY